MRYALSLAGLLAAVSGLSLPASAAEDTSPTRHRRPQQRQPRSSLG
jgi:hypothetical protein